jgi:hypothetical protein
VQLAGRVDDKGSGRQLDRLCRGSHRAAALEAEVDLGGVGVTMIRAGLTRFPTGDRDIALAGLPRTLSTCFRGSNAFSTVKLKAYIRTSLILQAS